MACILDPALVSKRSSLAITKLRLPNEEMHADPSLLMLDELSSFFAFWRSRVLAFPMKSMFVDPVVRVSMFDSLTLFVQSNEEHVGVFCIERNVRGIPISGVKYFTT